MHLYCIINDWFLCYQQWFFPRQHSPQDKYLISLKSNSHWLKLFRKTNSSVRQPVFITKTCFFYQTVCANSATFTVQYTLYWGYLPETQRSQSLSPFVNSFKRKELITAVWSPSQIFSKELFCPTKIQGTTNINITAKSSKLCQSHKLMFSFESRTTWNHYHITYTTKSKRTRSLYYRSSQHYFNWPYKIPYILIW